MNRRKKSKCIKCNKIYFTSTNKSKEHITCSKCEPYYKAICCVCGEILFIRKSIFHHMGMYEKGGGSCAFCKTYLNIRYMPNKQKSKRYMKTRRYEDM